MQNKQSIALIVSAVIVALAIGNLAGAIDKQTAQAEASLVWGQKLDCYYLVENEARDGKHSTFNMEECDY